MCKKRIKIIINEGVYTVCDHFIGFWGQIDEVINLNTLFDKSRSVDG